MSLTRELDDDIFGSLTKYQNGDWGFSFYTKAFEKELDISIEAGDDFTEKPSDDNYESFLWFRDNQSDFKTIVEKAIFDTYQSRIEDFRDGWGESADEKVPYLTNSEDIWKFASNPKVVFLSDFADLSVFFETTWDSEHGITVLIEDKAVVLVE